MRRFSWLDRLGTALGVLIASGSAWFGLAVYSGMEQMGARSHPTVDAVGWLLLAVAVTAAAIVCVELSAAVLLRLRQWSRDTGRE